MNEITVADLKAIERPTLIDVRERDEFAAGHVPGAVNLPLSETKDFTELPVVGEPIYLICQSGGRSGRATEYLEARGLDVVNVAGGTNAWIQSGFPIEEGTA